MHILFEKNYPNYLVQAIQLVHTLEPTGKYNIRHWDKSINENELYKPVVFLFDRGKKKLEITTEKLFESGYRVFAFKFSPTQRIDLFDFSLTVMGLWPKVMEVVKSEEKPFVYTYRYAGRKLKKVKE